MAVPSPRGYRSASEFRFREDQADAITRIAAYHRPNRCRVVIWFPSSAHADVLQSIATPFRRANSGLGSLTRLPLELLQDILMRLDMDALFKLRQTSLAAREAVDSLHQYQMVASHGLNLFRALLRTRLASSVSLSDFYAVLCTKACALCGEFGGFVFLLTWIRCCFKCLQDARETRAQTLAAVRRYFELDRAELDQLRSLRTLPGVYSTAELVHTSRVMIVSVHQAELVSGQEWAALSAARSLNPRIKQPWNFKASCALPHYDRRTGKVDYGLSCAGCQLALEKGIIGSKGDRWAYEVRDKVYSQDGFLEHFRWCEQAQVLWRSSGEGSHQPPELPDVAQKRGYFGSNGVWPRCCD